MTTIATPRTSSGREARTPLALADESVLTTIQAAELASRRLVRAAERRRQRYITVILATMVTAGATGTLAFAGLLVSGN